MRFLYGEAFCVQFEPQSLCFFVAFSATFNTSYSYKKTKDNINKLKL